MSWRPMSSWPATARACTPSGPRCSCGSRGAVNFELSLRERGYHWATGAGCCPTPPSCWPTPSPRWWTRAAASRCPACVRRPSRWRWPGPLAELDVGGGADDPAIDAHWRARPVGLGKGVRLEQPGRADLRRRRSGLPVNAIPPEASAWCQLRFVVGTDWRALETHVREHLRQAGFGQVRIRLGAQAGATRLSPDNAWVRWAAASIERSTGKRPALLQPGRLAAQRHLRRPAGPAHDLGAPLVPGLRAARAQRAPAGQRRPRGPGHHGRPVLGPGRPGTGPARRRRAPSTLTPRPRHVHQDPRRRNRPGPGRRRWRRDGARRLSRTADQDRRALHAGRRDRLGGAPAGQQAGRQAGPAGHHREPPRRVHRDRRRGRGPRATRRLHR